MRCKNWLLHNQNSAIHIDDFGALASSIRFMNPDDVDSAYILEELKKMQAEKKQHWEEEESGVKRKIGFGA